MRQFHFSSLQGDKEKMTNKGFTLIMSVLTIVVVALIVIAGSSAPLIYFNDGKVKMSAYSNVIKASDGMTYRVQVNDIFEAGKSNMRVADAYSLDSQYASITGVSDASHPGSWFKVSACSKEHVRTRDGGCYGSSEAEALLNELVRTVVTRENAIGNMEIFWSWEVGTKELIDQMKKK